MTRNTRAVAWGFAVACLLSLTRNVHAFDSGSTGADGDFAPVTDIGVQVPDGGVFNYGTYTIPTGVTVKYAGNAANTPVIILVSGDVTIEGSIDISGFNGSSPDDPGDFAGSGTNVMAGPGGFAGGRGGRRGTNGGNGFGPGGGQGGVRLSLSFGALIQVCGDTGAGFAIEGGTLSDPSRSSECDVPTTSKIRGGSAYGSERLLPLIGGSGGGGGFGPAPSSGLSLNFTAGSGGGGGGALLIAASGTVTLNGSILARGGDGGSITSGSEIGAGGGGSGGAVRIVATRITGTGLIDTSGGLHGTNSLRALSDGGDGSFGRIRLEAEDFSLTTPTIPDAAAVVASPGSLFVSNLPSIRIATVDGVAVPAVPNGIDDVVLPSTIVNPVTVEFEASGIPLGSTISLLVTPIIGAKVTAVSTPLAGTEDSSTASAQASLPQGPSVLSASVSFTVLASVGDSLSTFAKGERVESVTVAANLGSASTATFRTVGGKVYTWPSGSVGAAF